MNKYRQLLQATFGTLNRQDKGKLAIIVLMIVVGALFEMIGISSVLVFIQLISKPSLISENNILHFVYEKLSFTSTNAFYIACGFSLILFFIIKNVYFYLYYLTQHKFFARKRFESVSGLMEYFLAKPYSFYLQKNSSEILMIVQSGIKTVDKIWLPFMWILSESIILTVVLGLLFYVKPLETLIVVGLFAFIVVFFYKSVRKKIANWEKSSLDENVQAHKWLNQSFHGIKEVKVFGRESFFVSSFKSHYLVANEMYGRVHALTQVPRLIIESVVVLTIITLILIMLIVSGENIQSLIPALTMYALAAMRIAPSFNRIMSSMMEIKQGATFLERILAFKSDGTEHGSKLKAMNAGQSKSVLHLNSSIEIKNVTFKYQSSNAEILSDVSLSIPKGKVCGFVGPSGAGKSTLVDLIMGTLQPNSGKIMIDGTDLSGQVSNWRKNLGYVPQTIYLIDDTIRKNVAFGIDETNIDDEKVLQSLKKASLFEFVSSLPQGIQTKVGDRGVRLSGGQRQRLGIARALYNDPEVLIFDEATSSLDTETEAEISKSIDELSQNRTIIVIAHRLSTIKNADQIIFMEKGKLIDAGTFAQLVERNKRFSSFAEHA